MHFVSFSVKLGTTFDIQATFRRQKRTGDNVASVDGRETKSKLHEY